MYLSNLMVCKKCYAVGPNIPSVGLDFALLTVPTALPSGPSALQCPSKLSESRTRPLLKII